MSALSNQLLKSIHKMREHLCTLVEFICICILYRGNNFAKIISRFQYNTFGFVLCPLRLKLGCTVHQLARWLVTKSCCNQTAAELVVQPNCNTNSLLHQNGKIDQHGKMEKKIRPLSVSFLFRTSEREYHSQAGWTTSPPHFRKIAL